MPRQPPGQPPRRQRARYGPAGVEKLLGAPPVVASFCRSLDLAGEEVFAIPPEALNDDRIGRALDAIVPKLEQIVGSVWTRAITAFELQVARLH